MIVLVAGQNAELTERVVTFRLPRGADDLAALVLDEQRAATGIEALVDDVTTRMRGIMLLDKSIQIKLDELAQSVFRVLCIACVADPGRVALDCSVGDAIFSIAASDVHGATICFELYRRGATWKVRAVGQGYGGGLPELLAAHGVSETERTVEPSVEPASATDGPTAGPFQRLWMIYEDAARITAAFLSARDYAESRLEDELSAAVADPATRSTPSATTAATNARNRHEELLKQARRDYDRDARYLVNELRELDDELPPALASWKSSSWRREPAPSSGIRIGGITVPELGPLTVPFAIPCPLPRPLWIEAAQSAAAVPVVTALVLRLLVAAPHPAPTIDVIDLGDALRPFWQPLLDRMPRPVVTDSAGIGPRLQELIVADDLADMRESVEGGRRSPNSIVVFADFGFGLPAEALRDIVALAGRSSGRTSLILVGEDDWDGVDPLMRVLSEGSQHLMLGDGHVVDPWTRNVWNFVPDTAPEPGRTLSELLLERQALRSLKFDR